MDRPFFAAGLIYNPLSKQILLFRSNESDPYLLIGGIGQEEESPQETLQRHFSLKTKVKLELEWINTLYDYLNGDTNLKRYVFWVDFSFLKDEPYFAQEELPWFDLKDLHKAKLTGKTKQDLIFFQREMNALETETASTPAADPDTLLSV